MRELGQVRVQAEVIKMKARTLLIVLLVLFFAGEVMAWDTSYSPQNPNPAMNPVIQGGAMDNSTSDVDVSKIAAIHVQPISQVQMFQGFIILFASIAVACELFAYWAYKNGGI